MSPIVSNILDALNAELALPSNPTANNAADRAAIKIAVDHLCALNVSESSPTASTSNGDCPSPSAERLEHARGADIALRILLARARSAVRDTPWHLVTTPTLKLYTDASVLLAVLRLLEESMTSGSPTGVATPAYASSPGEAVKEVRIKRWRRTVKMLDKAIIVAGAQGPSRADWIHQLISAAQPYLHCPPTTPPSPYAGPRKRRRLSDAETSSPLFAPAVIPSILLPSFSAYASDPDLHSQPFILRGHLSSWPALARWKNADNLLTATGERYVPVEIGGAYDQKGWGQRILPWRQFLRRAGWDVGDAGVDDDSESTEDEAEDDTSDNEHGSWDDSSSEEVPGAEVETTQPPLYLAQTALFTQFPALERDFCTPDYAFAAPQLPGYNAPSQPLVNVWVGSGGREIVSPAHTDPYFNCYAQVLGRKRVWVAPPDVEGMAAYGEAGSSSAGRAANGSTSGNDAGKTGSELAGEYMTNTSRIPLFREDMATIKCEHPAFAEAAYPRAMEAVLEPGDMLVLPPRWWHSMRGEGGDPCWSISFWY